MLWLLPFLCSGAICWLNRDRIGVARVAPSSAMRPVFHAGPSYLALPQTAGYRNTPYGVGHLLLAPAASPFGYADAGPSGDPSAFMPPEPLAQVPPTAPATGPIALLRCSEDGCMIRPEPRPWDDATLGRMPGAFTAPKDFPVYVLSYGPVGWAHVLVNHPEDGTVEGWVETRSLTDAPIATTIPTSASPVSGPTRTATRTSSARNDAMARQQQFMRQQSRGGALPRPQQQN